MADCMLAHTLRKEVIMHITSPSQNGSVPKDDVAPAPSKKMGRRALIATGGLTALAVGVAEAPLAVNWGRRQLALELANLEGVGLDAASAAVDATYDAVNLIVMPIAGALTSISTDTIDQLINVIDEASKIPGVNIGPLAALRAILVGWRQNAALIPATVNNLEQVQRDAGKRYMTALKAKQQAEANKM
jgi:hypothetical protein